MSKTTAWSSYYVRVDVCRSWWTDSLLQRSLFWINSGVLGFRSMTHLEPLQDALDEGVDLHVVHRAVEAAGRALPFPAALHHFQERVQVECRQPGHRLEPDHGDVTGNEHMLNMHAQETRMPGQLIRISETVTGL